MLNQVNDMEIKKDKTVIITGKKICLVAGIVVGFCGIYWLYKALFFDDTELANVVEFRHCVVPHSFCSETIIWII